MTVLLAGVRAEFFQVMQNLHFFDWLPTAHVFREDPAVVGSATLAAVRFAYEQLGDDICEHCPRRTHDGTDGGAAYYMI